MKKLCRYFRCHASVLLAAAVVVGCANTDQTEARAQIAAETPELKSANELISNSMVTLQKFRNASNFEKLKYHANAILIVPKLYKAGLIAGGKGGKGVLLTQDRESGLWSAPVFYKVQSASVGLQIGVEVAQVAILITSTRALEAILGGDLSFGGDMTLARGREETKAKPTSDAYSYTISKGLFAGISLEGIKISADDNRNTAYYARRMTAREISNDETLDRLGTRSLREALRGRRFAEAVAKRSEAQTMHREADEAKTQAIELAQRLAEYEFKENERGFVLVLGDVLFDTAKSDLKPGARKRMQPLVEFLSDFPGRKVSVEGHTDNVGGAAFNKNLSLRRAEAVMNYLVSQGVSAGRVSAAGLGADLPVATNSTAEGRQQNRRVEIVIERPRLQTLNQSR